jgi:short-subunit dehydrogenase
MARKTSKKNDVDARIEKLYGQRCHGIQIDIMDISKVFKHAREVAETGADDIVLGDAIAAYVETIRKN